MDILNEIIIIIIIIIIITSFFFEYLEIDKITIYANSTTHSLNTK
jgi:hypothetical protein